jgi:hypothetical protein
MNCTKYASEQPDLNHHGSSSSNIRVNCPKLCRNAGYGTTIEVVDDNSSWVLPFFGEIYPVNGYYYRKYDSYAE